MALIGTLTVPLSAVGNIPIMGGNGGEGGGGVSTAAEVITGRQSWRR